MIEDGRWHYQRKTLNVAFNSERIKKLSECFQRQSEMLAECLLERMAKQEYVDFEEVATRVTFDLIGKAGFSFDFESVSINKPKPELVNIREAQEGVVRPVLYFLPFYQDLPLEYNRKIDTALGKTVEMVNKIITDRREQYEKHGRKEERKEKDVLDFILEAETETETKFSLKEMQNNIFMMFLAGHGSISFT